MESQEQLKKEKADTKAYIFVLDAEKRLADERWFMGAIKTKDTVELHLAKRLLTAERQADTRGQLAGMSFLIAVGLFLTAIFG